ncbi:MAG: Sec-independent protein translocase protein TatB [Steroidobacteraceae bacterium]
MFEVGFQELLLISVIALVVLGPERLPKLLAQVGRWVGKARSMARQFREQLESEVNLDDLGKTPPRSAQQNTPSYPPPGEAPPNEPSMSDSLSTAHLDPEPAPATDAPSPTDDTYSHAHAASEAPAYYHPEGDVYGGTAAPAPEVVTPEEPVTVPEPAVEEPVAPHGHRV